MKSGQEIWFIHNREVHKGVVSGCTSTQIGITSGRHLIPLMLSKYCVCESKLEALGKCIRENEDHIKTLDEEEKREENKMDTRAKELYQLHLEDKDNDPTTTSDESSGN
jgi:hypothetical protein